MGKVLLPGKQPYALPWRLSPWLIGAAVLGTAVLVLGGLLVMRAVRGPQTPLPSATSAQLPPLSDGPALPRAGPQQLPAGDALPQLDQQPPPAGQPLPSNAQQAPPAGPPLPNATQQPQQPQQPLTAVNPPSPAAGPPLPAVAQPPPAAGPPLSAVSQPPPAPSQALPQAAPRPSAPEHSGTVTWRWAIYPVDPQVLGILLGDKVAGNQFVALGVDVWNQSNAPIEVKSGDFRLVVDGRSYPTDVWATGSASIVQGLPVMSPEAVELLSGGSLSGTTSYMIPAQYQRLLPEWRLKVPKGVKVVRIDPQ